jgi:hypothetical protein
MAERGGRLVPTFKIGARGFLGRRDECQASNETSAWREEHDACRLERLEGERPTFPHETYGMRVLHGVDVAEPKADAIVARPGPLLHEVMAELEQRAAEGERAHRALLLDQVRAAWSAEAPNITNAVRARPDIMGPNEPTDDEDGRSAHAGSSILRSLAVVGPFMGVLPGFGRERSAAARAAHELQALAPVDELHPAGPRARPLETRAANPRHRALPRPVDGTNVGSVGMSLRWWCGLAARSSPARWAMPLRCSIVRADRRRARSPVLVPGPRARRRTRPHRFARRSEIHHYSLRRTESFAGHLADPSAGEQ